MVNLRAIRSNPVVVVVTAIFMWWFFYVAFALAPHYFASFGKSSIINGCNAIKRGMTLKQASEAMHRHYQPVEEIYSGKQIAFYGRGEGAACEGDLTEEERRVGNAHLRQLQVSWFAD